MGTPVLENRLQNERKTIALVWETMRRELREEILDAVLPESIPPFSLCEIRKDDFDGKESLAIEWRDGNGSMIGNMIIHEEGNVFAEYDIIKNHPTKQGIFVEAVNAWGTRNKVSAEVRTMSILE